MKRIMFVALFSALTLSGFSGCKLIEKFKPKPPKPAGPVETKNYATVGITGTSNMNNRNRVRVVVYQLQKRDLFMQSSREDFWLKQVFKPEIAGDPALAITLELDPSGQRSEKIQLFDNARFIGVAADFFRPNSTGWRTVHEIIPGRSVSISVNVQSNTVTIQ
jgi:type VI secretion system VasD/TssJ family lipoprotein